MSEETDLGIRTLAKVRWRLLPFIFLCYVIAYIDRINISFAAKSMQADLGLDDVVYGRGAGLFFLGYFLFEIPSNLILQRVGARIWIARIMIVWGLVSMAMVAVTGPWSFYGMRVLLGLAEAGFFPGMVLFLTYWFPARLRAQTGALFMIAAPVAALLQSPLSGALLELDGRAGLHGWQWLFLVEGFPALVLGILCLTRLTDKPEEARWLSADEREWLVREMAADRAAREAHRNLSLADSLRNPKVWLLCLIYFLNAGVTYGIFFWLPKMLEQVSGEKGIRLGFLTAIPFAAAIAGMILISRHSDRTSERRWHLACCAMTGAAGLVLAAFSQSSTVLFVLGFALCQVGQRSIMSLFWSIPPIFLGGTAAAAGIALINAIGNLGGHFGSDMMGHLKTSTGGYTGGLLVLAGALVLLSVLVVLLRLPKEGKA